MKKTPKPSPEFDTFTGFMDKLAKVPHGELKAKLDAEKAEKQANDWVKLDSQGSGIAVGCGRPVRSKHERI